MMGKNINCMMGKNNNCMMGNNNCMMGNINCMIGNINNMIGIISVSICVSADPCQNGGTCVPGHDGDGYQCGCQAGYRGRHCETGIIAPPPLLLS